MTPEASSIFLAQTAALVALLLSSLLVYRAFPQRYLLFWNGGWLLFLAHTVLSDVRPDLADGFWSMLLLLTGQAAIAVAAGIVTEQPHPFRWPLPVCTLAALGEALAVWFWPSLHGWVAGAGYFLMGTMAAGWILQYARRRHGWGAPLLGFALLLRLVHLPEWTPAEQWINSHAPEATTSVLAMLAMLVLALEATRQHLHWSAAPGAVATVAAEHAAPEKFQEEAFHSIAGEIQRIYEADFARLYLLPGEGEKDDPETGFLLSTLPRAAGGSTLCTTVIGPEKSRETEAWLRRHTVRWAVMVPIPRFNSKADLPTGLFVLGYRSRRWISPEAMAALITTGRQLGIVLENTRLLKQVSRSYREWLNTMDEIDDLVVVHDNYYRIQRVNRAMAERAGHKQEEMSGQVLREILPRSARTNWRNCPFCEFAAEGDTFDPDLNGYFLVSTSRFPREGTGVLHVAKDITDRKATEEKYRTMFEKVHEGVFISSVEGRFLECNDELARILGYSREELLQIDLRTLYADPQERDRYVALMRQQGYVSDYETQIRRKTGELITGMETSFAMRDNSGEIVQFQGFLLDITTRKKAEDELHRHVQMLSSVKELAESMTGSLDPVDLLRTTCRGLRLIFGFDRVAAFLIDPASGVASRVAEEGAGTAPENFALHPAMREFFKSDRRTVLPASDTPLTSEMLALQKAQGMESVYLLRARTSQIFGTISMAWRSKRVLTAAEENLLGAVGRQLEAALENASLYQQTRQAYDELRRTQEQLLQSEKMAAVGQLVSGVAHELNNPLTAILGYGQLLGSQVTPKGAEYVDKLLHQARRTQRIIQNLLSFSRQTKPERRPLDLNIVIEEALVLREYELRTGNVRIERKLADSLPMVYGDAHQLEQVFLNVINNAWDAIRETNGPGVLQVTTYVDNGSVVADFIDNGTGVKEIARVFDPFYTTKEVGKGTGLGLSICYGILKEHGGEIMVINNTTRGATFRVRLPAAQGTMIIGKST